MNFKKYFQYALFAFVFSWSFRVDALFFDGVFIHLADLFLLLAGVFFAVDLALYSRKRVFNLGDFYLVLGLFVLSVLAFLSDLNGYVWGLFSAFYLLVRFSEVKLRTLVVVFLAGVSVNAFVAILQFLLQGSVGLHFLGESVIGPDVLEVAKIDFAGKKIVRSYGFFAHPNVLAGHLLVGLFLCFDLWKRTQKKVYKLRYEIVGAFLLFALFLTFSRAAILASVPMLIYYFWKERLSGLKRISVCCSVVLVVLYFSGIFDLLLVRFMTEGGGAISKRLDLNLVAFKLFFENVWGVGFGNFTETMGNYLTMALAPWDYQPVHNIYLLSFVELGVLGGMALLFLHGRALVLGLRNSTVYLMLGLGVLILGMFDHYLFSSYAGGLLFTWYLLLADYDFH